MEIYINKIFAYLRSKIVRRTDYAALKLDMSKAYDQVEWDFSSTLMGRLGFAESLMTRIMNSATSMNYSFRINGEVFGSLRSGRGLRQENQLSSYLHLFLLCAHGLTSLFNSYEAQGLIRGVKIVNTCPSVSHLFSADDNLIFFKASTEEGARVRECLVRYERASGQCVNFDQPALSFSPNTNPQLIETIKAILIIPVVQRHDLYLGLLTVSMRSKKLQFKYLLERVHKSREG
ncbi:uncharacterized protein [Henckelia pumila]|uniref:uncharacterized protein n=1 Tax=Henckelia pumila TaxID=405737 RepID=UPI003C6DC162